MDAIKITNLTKKYGDLLAVDNLNLTIKKGELFSLLGLNGAGKTTTIKMLSCLTKPTSGDATMLGNSIKTNPFAVKEKIGISPQETSVAANLTVFENLEFIAGIHGQDKENRQRNAYQIAKQFGLEDVLKKRAQHLSGGMQRRLAIAMALISEPQILFLDEPTLGVDILARRELWAFIRSLKGKVTIVLTTHYLEEVEALSDRVGVMVRGKLAAVGTVEELLEQTGTKSLEDAFVSLAGGVV